MTAEAIALAADLHLAPGAGEEAERLRSLLAEVSRRASRLYFLGDLFDFWVGRNMEKWGPWSAAAEVFRSSPVPLHFLAGNRDYLAGAGQLESMGIRLSPEETLLDGPGGKRWLLLHGDQLCTRDLAYQRARRFLRSLPAQGITRVLPFSLKLRIAGFLRRRSARSLVSRDPECLAPTLDAVRTRLSRGAEGILCGHLHQVGRFSLPGGEEPVLFALPPWVEKGEWALLEEDEGPKRMGPRGEEIPWPPMEVLR